MTNEKTWKVGELANQTGLTVRTLHHYDELGLLTPSRRSDAGHRIYTETDITRLQQILSLKQLGFPLEQIKVMIDDPDFRPGEAIRMQLERLNEQIRIQEDLLRRLEELHRLINEKQNVTSEQLIQIIEVMKLTESYFTPEQMEKIKKQGEQLGPEKIKKVENEWSVLIAKVRAELEKGTPPEHPEVVELARRWQELVSLFTGGDAGITKAAERFYQENPDKAAETGIDKELYEYISQAFPNT